jgi:hypothetical protein
MPTRDGDVVISRRPTPITGYWVWPVIRDGQQREDHLPAAAFREHDAAIERGRTLAAHSGGTLYFQEDDDDPRWMVLLKR